MSSSNLHTGGGSVVSEKSAVRDLTPQSTSAHRRPVDLSTLGFHGFVSPHALDQIKRAEKRASRVVTTAATFAFR